MARNAPTCECDGPPSDPSPLTSLDALETTPQPDTPTEIYLSRLPALTPVQAFRHSGWATRRAATWTALLLAQVGRSREDRYAECGSIAWVMAAADGSPQYRIATNRCRDRFCEACAGERRRQVARNLHHWLQARHPIGSFRPGQYPVRFLTLTLKSSEAPLAETISRLCNCFNRLRRRRPFTDLISGGLMFLEIKRGRSSGLWHPHLHVLVEGKYIPQKLLSDHWLAITGDSFIVHVEALSSPAKAVSYVAKYSGKALDASVWRNSDHLVEAIKALAGRRSFQTFGDWKSLDLSKDLSAHIQWVAIASLGEILAAEKAHDLDACRIMRHLRGEPIHAPNDLDRGPPPLSTLSDLPD